jgi:hypothetical protein
MKRARVLAALVAALGGCALPRTQGAAPMRQAAWVDRLTDAAPAVKASDVCLGSEAEAVRYALSASPAAARFEGEARALTARSRMSFADPPELRLSNLRLDRMVSGPERAELALRLPIARPGTLSGEGLVFEAEAEGARARAQLERVALATETRVVWARRLNAAERVVIARAEEARLAGLVKARAGQGRQVSAIELEVSSAEHLRTQAERSAAEGDEARWQAELATLSGAPACETTSPLELAPTGGVDEALASRAEVAGLFAEREQAELARTLAERAAWPWFRWVQLAYEVDGGFAPDTFGVAFAIELPIGAWDGAAAEAEAARIAAIDSEASLWVQRIKAEVGAARQQLERRRAELTELESLVASLSLARIEALRAAAPSEVLADDLDGLYRDRARLLDAVAQARLGVLEARARLLAALGRVD